MLPKSGCSTRVCRSTVLFGRAGSPGPFIASTSAENCFIFRSLTALFPAGGPNAEGGNRPPSVNPWCTSPSACRAIWWPPPNRRNPVRPLPVGCWCGAMRIRAGNVSSHRCAHPVEASVACAVSAIRFDRRMGVGGVSDRRGILESRRRGCGSTWCPSQADGARGPRGARLGRRFLELIIAGESRLPGSRSAQLRLARMNKHSSGRVVSDERSIEND